MDEQEGKQVRFVFAAQAMPPPLFANHIQAMSTTEFTTLTFYAALFPAAYASAEELPDEVEARPVAQVVVPQKLWEQLLGNIFAKRAEGTE